MAKNAAKKQEEERKQRGVKPVVASVKKQEPETVVFENNLKKPAQAAAPTKENTRSGITFSPNTNNVEMKAVIQVPTQISMPTAGKKYSELSTNEKYRFWQQDNKIREERDLGTDWSLAANFLGNLARDYGMSAIESGEEAATKLKDKPLQARIAQGLAGIFGTPAIMSGQGAIDLTGGENLDEKPRYVRGVSGAAFGVAGLSPVGALFNAAFNQPEIVSAMEDFEEFKQKNLEKLYKTKIGSSIGEEGKDAISLGIDLFALAAIHKTAKLPFKTTKVSEIRTPEGAILAKIPTDRQWWADVKKDFQESVQHIIKDPIGYIEQNQFGLSIKDVSGESNPLGPKKTNAQQELPFGEQQAKASEATTPIPTEALPEKVATLPKGKLPTGKGETKVSRLEARVQGVLNKATPDLIEKLGLPTYQQLNKAETIKKATNFVRKSPEDALRVLTGEIEPPKGVLRNSVYVAMQNFASGDVNLARRIASLESTRLGQELSILTEIDKNSPVSKMTEIIRIREKRAERLKKGKSTNEIIDGFKKDMRKVIKKAEPKKYSWEAFLEEIKC